MQCSQSAHIGTGEWVSHPDLSSNADDRDAKRSLRRFIRHPSDIPIDFTVLEATMPGSIGHQPLLNVSRGGLSFYCDLPMRVGAQIQLRIPIADPAFEAEGTVVWCEPESARFIVGVAFSDHVVRYALRMVEQVCHIEHYRSAVASAEGRHISSEEAAEEWVSLYAKDFPTH